MLLRKRVCAPVPASQSFMPCSRESLEELERSACQEHSGVQQNGIVVDDGAYRILFALDCF
jgi:hypothetical protein